MSDSKQEAIGHEPEEGAGGDQLQRQLLWSNRRVRELLDEINHGRSDSRRLRDSLQRAEEEQRRLSRLLAQAEALVRQMDAGIRMLQQSVSFQLGYVLTQSVRSLRGMLALPVRLFRLAGFARRNERAAGAMAVPVPYGWFPSTLRNELEAFRGHYRDSSAEPAHEFRAAPRPRAGRLPEAQSELRIAAIMDEFTFSAYRECCQVFQLTAGEWRSELEAAAPHMLFIESAWDGRDSSWLRKVSGASAELRDLVGHCRSAGIPVVFWSKEDPVHFRTFLGAARLADVVFTTDIDCIRHYKDELGHDRVFLLPFATQPLAHNPLERYERKPGFCFAGSYYVRYPVRQRDFRNLLEAASRIAPVDIYDRNHGKDHPNYVFPPEYHRYILGNLPFDQIDLAYKGYEFGININTVKHSQSMFARRVFDLVASNTTTISNYSRGLRLMLGDLVLSSDDSRQLARLLEPMSVDSPLRRKHRLAGLRKVMGEHTYQQRLAYLTGKVFGTPVPAPQPLILVLARAGSEGELERLLASFHRQSWPHRQLLLSFAEGFRPQLSPVGPGIEVLSDQQAASRRVSSLARDGYVAGFHPDDYYGPNYLADLALATSFSPVPVIGKVSYYQAGPGGTQLVGGMRYAIAGPVAHRRGMAPCGHEDDTVAQWLDGIEAGTWTGDCLAVDEFSYCAGLPGASACAVVDDLAGLDTGLPVAELLRTAERIHAHGNPSADSDESAGLPGLEAEALYQGLGKPENKHLRTALVDGTLVVESSLPGGSHGYAYLAGRYAPSRLGWTDIARMQLVTDSGDALGLVLIYHDASGNRISHSLLKAGANSTVVVPGGTHDVQLGIRVGKAGTFAIRRLVFDHVPLSVDMLVTRGRHLLVAKNYPSYRDLYKHAFVHRRVVGYQRHGLDVDVFRIGAERLGFTEFDGVDIVHGQADDLRTMLRSGGYESVLVHVLDERTWEVIQEFRHSTRIHVWAHGSEIQPAERRECDQPDADARVRAKALGDRRMAFWRRIFSEAHPNVRFVFVSEWSARTAMADVGVELPPGSYQVVHNFIDTDLFEYLPKPDAQRMKILSIRPFSSRVYANDLTVAAILELSRRDFFERLEFHLVGDGPLFDSTVEPLRRFPNVTIEKGFLPQARIARLHREFGVFLVPSRMDSQGVSRDEAMASGLVPVTTRVAAIPEFVDDSCGFLVDEESPSGLADAIERLYGDAGLFQSLSRAAAARVRRQSGYARTILREVEMFDGPALP